MSHGSHVLFEIVGAKIHPFILLFKTNFIVSFINTDNANKKSVNNEG